MEYLKSMCGIVGCVDLKLPVTDQLLTSMAERIRYRGPDSSGTWLNSEVGVGFGHRRLSIIDLSPAGHQPMHSSSGRYTIVFNGEIFNYRELINEHSLRLRGGSDTEVMLECFELMGVSAAVPHFVGMFAFALWDHHERTLTLVRDRLGIKPLYYGWCGSSFVFSSDMHAFRAHPGWKHSVNVDALSLFIRYGYVPAPWSISNEIWKLPAGTALTIPHKFFQDRSDLSPFSNNLVVGAKQYWSIEEISKNARLETDPDIVIADLEALLDDAIRLRMIADVSIGCVSFWGS